MFSQRAIIPWLEYQVLVVVRDDRTPMLPFIFRRELIRSAIVSNTAAGSAAVRFFPFFFFGFITHARPTSPLGSFTFLRASIIVQGPLLTQIRVHFVATTWPGSSRLSSISVLYRCFSVFTLHPAPGYSTFLSHASLHCCRLEFRARVRVSR